MKHDEQSEANQNEAIRLLASAISGLASQGGHSGYKQVVTAVEALVGGGSPPVEAPEPEPLPKADLSVSGPVPGDVAAAADAVALKKEVADVISGAKTVKAST